jgi:hypothetical protein
MTEQIEQQNSSVVLGLADLALMANIIQVTSERGAIKAGEMQTVGALYSKLVAFVNANLPQTDGSNNEDAALSAEGE